MKNQVFKSKIINEPAYNKHRSHGSSPYPIFLKFYICTFSKMSKFCFCFFFFKWLIKFVRTELYIKKKYTHTPYSNSEKIYICSLKLTCFRSFFSSHISIVSQCLIHASKVVQNKKTCWFPKETLRQKQKPYTTEEKQSRGMETVETAQMNKHHKDEENFCTNICKRIKFKKEH